MADNESDFERRLQNAIWGMPVLRPDEQHRCLGTFYERIDLRVSFQQALQRDFTLELTQEIHLHPEYYLLFNGKLDDDILSQYVGMAQRTQTQFAIRNDRLYRYERESAAIILASLGAINMPTIDIVERFPEPFVETTSNRAGSFWNWLFKMKH
ncbi:YueI family protein [Lactiplantibacillus paraplantarum]|uniref:DUF1694 domain-containing protein n=1 Tax=Lactiplantibacillus paraplantarum TaxID=60520 RepID=A0ABQ0NDP5_9LACO|nr:YueI family protein [Lactiplantibacillus paraplantarum]ERL45845.1 hypothetical protein N644_0038 [Lactiplantibacillus paraplantarum]MCU4685148.1 YueI family protein [Lactiplantibacillus paraplantarum]QJU50874.1 hypothetical protein CK401_01769 [Lactiplantibacillus paraplantarum]UKB40369.1 YueI family protein [Lactiplantibacillus paraplantarum]GBF02552.1 hypothetical protein LPPLD21_02102 [Lactiplantibacillus paraplantarum]